MHTARSSSHLLGGVSASVHAGIHPQVWAWTPPWPDPNLPPGLGLDTPPPVWAWTPPSQTPNLPLGLGLDPPTSTLGLGLDTPPQARPPQPPPWVWA